jgi:acyl-CoA synthetase (AMP-forming)/AMP-acid ligase II
MSRAPEGAATCTEVLRRRAALAPDREAFLYLPDGEAEGERLTYAALDARARGLAARLQAAGHAGGRALLGFAPGLDFVVGFFGCLYAGVVAVPIDLPENPEAARRVGAIAADAGVSVVLAPEAAAPAFARDPALAALPFLALDAPGDPDAWRDPGAAPGDLAFLQYTSGSTAAPRA